MSEPKTVFVPEQATAVVYQHGGWVAFWLPGVTDQVCLRPSQAHALGVLILKAANEAEEQRVSDIEAIAAKCQAAHGAENGGRDARTDQSPVSVDGPQKKVAAPD
jgi:hypothetical protein